MRLATNLADHPRTPRRARQISCTSQRQGERKPRRMTQIQQEGSNSGQTDNVLQVKRPISERKLQANRANATRSTGPKTAAGKASSRRNALKHGILSRSIDLPPATSGFHLRSLKINGSLVAEGLGTHSALQDIERICEKMARVLALEKDCMQGPDGLSRNGRLLHRYERTLTTKLHARIRELGGLTAQRRKRTGRSL